VKGEALKNTLETVTGNIEQLQSDLNGKINRVVTENEGKRPWNQDFNSMKDDIAKIKLELETKITGIERGSLEMGKQDIMRLELKELELEKETRMLRERLMNVEKRLEVIAGGQKTMDNYLKEQILLETLQNENKMLKEQQHSLSNVFDKFSREFAETKL